VVLPFTGLSNPSGVAVNGNGYVFVTDTGNNRVVELPTSGSQTVLGFSSLNAPSGVALDQTVVFVGDATTTRELWANTPSYTKTSPPWQTVTSTEFVGPFSGLQTPRGLIDGGNWVYVVDSGNNRVLKWHGGNTPDVVPFTGLNSPDGIALTQNNSDVWVADTGNNRVLRLQTFNQPAPVQTVLPFTGLTNPHGVALDPNPHPDGPVLFVADTGNNRVLKLTINDTTHTATQSILPFAGLNKPTGVTTDGTGNLYVVDNGNNRVLKLDKAFAAQ